MLQDGAHLDERAFVGQDQGQGRARVGLDFEDQAPVACDLVLLDALFQQFAALADPHVGVQGRVVRKVVEFAARELQDYKTAYECAARQLKL